MVEWLIVGRVYEPSVIACLPAVFQEVQGIWVAAQGSPDGFEQVCKVAAGLVWLPALPKLVSAVEACLAVPPPADDDAPLADDGEEMKAATPAAAVVAASGRDLQLYTDLVYALHEFLKPSAQGPVASGLAGGGGARRGSGSAAKFAPLAEASQAL